MNITTINDERTARIALSHLVEPGDRVLGASVALRGPVEALHRLASDADPATEDEQGLLNRAQPRLGALRESDLELPEGFRAVIFGDADWIPSMGDLGTEAPLVLYMRGDTDVLRHWEDRPSVSIIGARASTAYGDHVTSEIVDDLVADPRKTHSVAIVSGAAYGIDGAAHRAALNAGGLTVAFLAGGVDRPYPLGHADLLNRIAERGVVVSEMPPGSVPTKWRFLARNRLIAAATPATVVVESGARSGSINTAGHVNSIGHRLGAVPGPVTSAASAGCHRLIQDHRARIVTSAADVRGLIGMGDQS